MKYRKKKKEKEIKKKKKEKKRKRKENRPEHDLLHITEHQPRTKTKR